MDTKSINPLTTRQRLRVLFNSISDFYEFMNKLMSFGIDGRWRDRFAELGEGKVLDLACGTGEVMSRLSCNPSVSDVFGADISEKMMKWGRENKSFCKKVFWVAAEAENLPFRSEEFDTVSVAFGLRNFQDRAKAIEEIKRVLRKGGKLIILDTLRPQGVIYPFYRFYLERIIPSITSIFVGDRNSYLYMARSILNFLTKKELSEFLEIHGFSVIKSIDMTFGVATIFVAEKK